MPLLCAIAAFGGAFLKSRDASAYCNKSTCDPKKEDCARDKFECVSSGHGYYWTERPIPWRFHYAGTKRLDASAVRAAVRRAFQAWESVECPDGPTSLSFEEGEESDTELESGSPAPYDYAIYFRDSGWSEDAADLAVTRHDGGLRTGKVFGASIEVNTAGKTFRVGDQGDGIYDLEAVMVHEVGHYLGLDHSQEKDTVMHPTYCDDQLPCPRKVTDLRRLGSDDIAAVCRLYPPEKPTLNPASSCSVSVRADNRPDAASHLHWWAFGVPLVAFAVRRRRIPSRAVGSRR